MKKILFVFVFILIALISGCYYVDNDTTTLEISSTGEGVILYSFDNGDLGMIVLSGVIQEYINLPTKGVMWISVESYTSGEFRIQVIERKGKGTAAFGNTPIERSILFSFRETTPTKVQKYINL